MIRVYRIKGKPPGGKRWLWITPTGASKRKREAWRGFQRAEALEFIVELLKKDWHDWQYTIEEGRF